MRISDWSSDVCSSHTCAPPANMYDFSFLAPCPSSGIIVQGTADEVVTASAVQKLVDKQIGRASRRERVCEYVYMSEVVVSLNNKTTKQLIIRDKVKKKRYKKYTKNNTQNM